MAEQVQAVLDQMVAPLRDLMDRGIFTESEIRAIVSRRRDSEYLLRRRAARKADFLRYIEAEMTLEKLRAIRTRQVLQRQARTVDKKNKETKKKSHIGDSHIVSHIHFLFIRMLRKFRSDVSLHLQHAAFAKESKSFTRLGRIYAEALQVHPRNVGLWIEAASHEFFGSTENGQQVGGGSVQGARVLLQRGLRVNPNSKDLWLQYFCLEFHHIQKLRGRREILQLEQQESPGDETDPLFSEATIPTVVYKNAIKAIPDSVTFRLQFLDMLRLFPQTDAAEAVIMESIEEDFQDQPEAWIARAAHAVEQIRKKRSSDEEEDAVGFVVVNKEEADGNEPPQKKQRGDPDSASDKVIYVLQEAAHQNPTAEMYLHCIQFARSYMEQLAQEEVYDASESSMISTACKEAKTFVDNLLIKAKEDNVTSTDLVMEHVDILVCNGQLNDAAKVMEDHVLKGQKGDTATLVWINWARLAEQLDPPRPAAEILQMALKRIPIHDRNHMMILLELFAARLRQVPQTESEKQARDKELSDLFQRVLLLTPGEQYRGNRKENSEETNIPDTSVAGVVLQYLQYTIQENGLNAVRNVYEALFRSNYCQNQSPVAKSQNDLSAMKEVFDECIRFEKDKTGRNPRGKAQKELNKQLRQIYNAAVSFFQDVEPSLADVYRQGRDEDVRFR